MKTRTRSKDPRGLRRRPRRGDASGGQRHGKSERSVRSAGTEQPAGQERIQRSSGRSQARAEGPVGESADAPTSDDTWEEGSMDAARESTVPAMQLLRAHRRPGPPGSDVMSQPEQDLEAASRVLELVDAGRLQMGEPPPPVRIPTDALGKPLRRLTAQDEYELGMRLQVWGDVDARNTLVLANLGLVHLVANQMRRQGLRYEDLVQEGTLGLLRATETFEPERGIRFSTYCVYWIRAKIQRYLQRLDRDDAPSISGAEMETLESGRRRRPKARAVSIDTPVDDDENRSFGEVLADKSEDPEDATIRFQRARTVDQVLHEIADELGDPRLQTIIEKRLLAEEPETLAVLGDRLNLSREGARLLETKVLRLARQRLNNFRESA
jgi:RNA polymerase sigma factor (sigma-70 family)